MPKWLPKALKIDPGGALGDVFGHFRRLWEASEIMQFTNAVWDPERAVRNGIRGLERWRASAGGGSGQSIFAMYPGIKVISTTLSIDFHRRHRTNHKFRKYRRAAVEYQRRVARRPWFP